MSTNVQIRPKCASRSTYEIRVRLPRLERYNHYIKKDGSKGCPKPTRNRDADLILTAYFDPVKNHYIVYMITIDLDYKDVVNDRFKVDEKISWDRLKEYLEKNHKKFKQKITKLNIGWIKALS